MHFWCILWFLLKCSKLQIGFHGQTRQLCGLGSTATVIIHSHMQRCKEHTILQEDVKKMTEHKQLYHLRGHLHWCPSLTAHTHSSSEEPQASGSEYKREKKMITESDDKLWHSNVKHG